MINASSLYSELVVFYIFHDCLDERTQYTGNTRNRPSSVYCAILDSNLTFSWTFYELVVGSFGRFMINNGPLFGRVVFAPLFMSRNCTLRVPWTRHVLKNMPLEHRGNPSTEDLKESSLSCARNLKVTEQMPHTPIMSNN